MNTTDGRLRSLSGSSELWLPIAGYEGLYEVSNFGRVKSFKKARTAILKGGPGTCPMRYRRVTLRGHDGLADCRYIHIVVLETFRGPRPMGMWALHKDGNVENCALSNLYWGTPKENTSDRIRHGIIFTGSRNPNARLSEDEIYSIRSEYAGGNVRQHDLAEKYGVSQVQISRITSNSSWR
jgi:hypothetical protein